MKRSRQQKRKQTRRAVQNANVNAKSTDKDKSQQAGLGRKGKPSTLTFNYLSISGIVVAGCTSTYN